MEKSSRSLLQHLSVPARGGPRRSASRSTVDHRNHCTPELNYESDDEDVAITAYVRHHLVSSSLVKSSASLVQFRYVIIQPRLEAG